MGIVIGMMGIEPTWRVATGIWNRPVFLLQHLPMDVCATIVCDLCVRPLCATFRVFRVSFFFASTFRV